MQCSSGDGDYRLILGSSQPQPNATSQTTNCSSFIIPPSLPHVRNSKYVFLFEMNARCLWPSAILNKCLKIIEFCRMDSWLTRSRLPASALLLKWRSLSIGGFLLFLTLIYLYPRSSTSNAGRYGGYEYSEKYPSKETLRSLSLTEEQCDATFPGLSEQIDVAVARGSFRLKKGPDTAHGSVEGRIKDGKVGWQAPLPFDN